MMGSRQLNATMSSRLRSLSEFAVRDRGSVNPTNFPDETFDLFSIPAYESGRPEELRGSQIGSSKISIEPGDVLISKIVPHIQRVWIVPERNGRRQIASGEWIVFRGAAIAPEFLRHMLLTQPFHKQFMQTVAGMGGSLLRARPSEVARIAIPVPNAIEEQRQIAAILDKADAIRRKREQALALAEDLLKSAFLDLFGDPLSNPKKWPVRPLGEYIEEIRYGTSTKCRDTKGESDVAVLRIPNVVDGAISWQDLKFTNLPRREVERLSMRSGDILFVRTNGNPEYIGRCAVFESDLEAVFASYLIRARLRSDSPVTPLHVRTAISMPSYRHRVIQEAKTTAGNYNVNIQGLSSLPIVEPPRNLQAIYSKLVVKTMLIVQRKDDALKQANDLFGTLSGRAFRGEHWGARCD